jgi:hypothetical protein
MPGGAPEQRRSADAHAKPSGALPFSCRRDRVRPRCMRQHIIGPALQRPLGSGNSVTTIPQSLKMPPHALSQHTETIALHSAACAARPAHAPMSTQHSTPRLHRAHLQGGLGMCGAGRPRKLVLSEQVWPSSPEPLTAPKHASSVCARHRARSCASPVHGSWKGRAELREDTRHMT